MEYVKITYKMMQSGREDAERSITLPMESRKAGELLAHGSDSHVLALEVQGILTDLAQSQGYRVAVFRKAEIVGKQTLCSATASEREPGPKPPIKHMTLFKCQTINQFRIGAWLVEQGITDEDISFTEFPGRDTVKIYNPAGQYMIIHWRDGRAEIDTE